jgi:hypothetical protein
MSLLSLIFMKVHTLPVITEAHLGLAETNGVFSGTDAIVRLERSLVDTL